MFGVIFEAMVTFIVFIVYMIFNFLKIVVNLAFDLPVIILLSPLYVTALVITFIKNFIKIKEV